MFIKEIWKFTQKYYFNPNFQSPGVTPGVPVSTFLKLIIVV